MMPLSVLAAAPTCLVCGTPISPLDARTRRVCRNVACAWRHATLDPRHACAVCSRPLAVAEWALGVCHDVGCRHAWLVERPAALHRAQQEELRAHVEVLREAHAPIADVDSPDAFAITLIPVMDAELVPVRQERRDALRARLAEVLGTLLSTDVAPEPSSALPAEVVPVDPASIGAACATCRGHCCRYGAEHAYLTPVELRRWLDAHPDAAPEAVVDAYVSYADSETYAGSCIYHRGDGCALPREMRSSTCNRFFCGELRPLLHIERRPRFVVAASGAKAVRAAFVDGSDVRPIALSPAADTAAGR